MILLVDAGNSRVKWACWERGLLEVGVPFATDSKMLPEQLQLCCSAGPKPALLYLSNVAGSDWERRFVSWLRRAGPVEIHVVRSQPEAFGLVNGYQQPERLGVDRWVGLIGARARFGLPVCLIDFGTAITVDLVDQEGRHRGGLIAPGLDVLKESLTRRAAAVSVQGVSSGAFWGRTTDEGVASGAREMVLGMIERVFRQARVSIGMPPILVLTGGDAERIAVLLNLEHRLAPDLVLWGLAEIASNDSSAAAGR